MANSINANLVIHKKGFNDKEYSVLNYIRPITNRYISFKYFFEYMLTALITISLLPLLGIVSIIIKLDSKGDILFKQIRYGHSGVPFYILKFRTMVSGAHLMQEEIKHLNEMDGGKLFKSDKDPRITRLGKFLRKTSIDELPQLINILKGEMTLIGPRPLSTPLEDYDIEDLNRFKLKPGLGCIWQAKHRGETDFKQWMKTDSEYVNTISPKLDLTLFFCIIKNVIIGKGAR